MKRILFVYGYGGSPDSTFCTLIREALPSNEFEVVSYEYPQQDCAAACDYLQQVLARESFDLVMGTSLGGFITLSLNTTLPKIVLNPCMLPSVELPLLKPRPDHPEDAAPSAEMIASYKPFEEHVFDPKYNRSRCVYGLFAKEDELLGTRYKQRFIDCYDIARDMPGGHHGNALAIPVIIKAVREILAPGTDND